MLSVIGPVGLVLLAAVAAVWVLSLVNAVLGKAMVADKDIKVIVRLLPWPRVEIVVSCKGAKDHECSEGRKLGPRDGEAPAAEPKV